MSTETPASPTPARTHPPRVELEPIPSTLLAPRWWPAWLGLGLLWLLTLLPLPLLRALGRVLGRAFGCLVKSRRRVVMINLRLCFPELSEAEREARATAHFEALGMGIFESLMAWMAPDRALARYFDVEGVENLHKAQQGGRGALLLTGHFTTLEIAARALVMVPIPVYGMYRSADNAFVDYWMRRWRLQRATVPPVPKEDLRELLRVLRRGGAVWYGPDQSLEVENAIHVPFFGVPTLTLTATTKLSQLGRAAVVPFFPERINGRYRIRILPALEDFPSGDELADARRINALLEQAILHCPEQYFWVHKRFKYPPPGMPNPYD